MYKQCNGCIVMGGHEAVSSLGEVTTKWEEMGLKGENF